MNAIFGNSTLMSVSAFSYMLSLLLLRSAHPNWYSDVGRPFVLPAMSSGTKALTSYECYFEMSVIPSDGKSIRDVLGETPTVLVKNLEGAVTARVIGWSNDGRLHVTFAPAEPGSCIGQVESILDSSGKVRWTNPEA